jgi:hypothetical protein
MLVLKIIFNNAIELAMETRHLVILCLSGLLACTTVPAPDSTPVEEPADDKSVVDEPTEQTKPANTEPFELFGEELGTSPEIDLEDLVANPTAYRNKKIITSGVVRQSCQTRGCWMDVRPKDQREATSVTVRFKNYGFFVPLNSRGASVRMEGITEVTTMTADEVKHMEDEGAVISNKKADGSAEIVEFTASGVEMRGRTKTK